MVCFLISFGYLIILLHFAQLEKFKNYDFGRCPRVYCCGQPCLPAGQSDIPRSSTVKIYCPKCEELHYPRSKYQGSILLKFWITLAFSCDIFIIHPPDWLSMTCPFHSVLRPQSPVNT